MILISAGQGRVSRAVAAALASLPGEKRLALLRPAPAAGFPPEFAVQAAPPSSPQERRRLLAGVSDLVLVPVFDQRAVEQHMALAAVAKESGVERIHLLSASGAAARSPVTLLRWIGLVEREIAAAGLPHTILRCMPYMQTIPHFMQRDASGWRIVGPFRETAIAWLDALDAGAAIARRIESAGGDGLVCELSGPEEAGFDMVSSLLAAELREAVRYVDICLPEAEGMLEAQGFPPARIRAITEYWDYLASGVLRCGCCAGADRLLGRPRRTLAAYLREYAAELRHAA
jgi:NAD(P)H dehydrogenase (quinone)